MSRLLPVNHSRQVFDGIFYLTHIRNKGAAFGILSEHTVILIFISLVFIAAIIYYFSMKKRDVLFEVSVAFILGGSFGNLIDRLSKGYVVDFFEIRHFTIFNVADIFINIGVALFAYRVLFGKGARVKGQGSRIGTE